MITFEPLRILLVKRGIKKMKFIEECKIAPSTAAKLWKDEYVSLEVVDKICSHYKVPLIEVMEHKQEQEG